jgi:hypothetical protein
LNDPKILIACRQHIFNFFYNERYLSQNYTKTKLEVETPTKSS